MREFFRRSPLRLGSNLLRTGTVLLALAIPACSMPERFIFNADRNPDLLPSPTALRVEEILFPAEDGARIYGWYLEGKEGEPVVLYFHGTSTHLSAQIDNLSRLQKLGVSTFIFDYRGFGRSEGDPSERGTYSDARGALNYLQQRGWENGEILYYGHSLGSAIALQLALESPPAGLILESPFTSLADLICHHLPSCAVIRWAFGNYYDSLAKIPTLKSPLLVLQGARDTVVPVAMAQGLYDRADVPKTLIILPDAGHADLSAKGGKRYWEGWRTFIRQTQALLPADAT